MMGGDEHNDIKSRTGGAGYANWAKAPGDKETWWWNDKVQEVIHAKQVAKKIWETSRRLREETTNGDEQFGFMLDIGTPDAIFSVLHIMEKYREKQKGLHYVFYRPRKGVR